MNSEMAYLSIGSNLKLAPVSCAICGMAYHQISPIGLNEGTLCLVANIVMSIFTQVNA